MGTRSISISLLYQKILILIRCKMGHCVMRPLRQHLLLRGLKADSLVQVHLLFLFTGYDSTKPNVIIKLEQGEEPWIAEWDVPCHSHPGQLAGRYIVRNGHPRPSAVTDSLHGSGALSHTSQDPSGTYVQAPCLLLHWIDVCRDGPCSSEVRICSLSLLHWHLQ